MTDLIGKYRLTHLLGRGGFADVYLGEHIHLARPVAIKILHERLIANDRNSFQFLSFHIHTRLYKQTPL